MKKTASGTVNVFITSDYGFNNLQKAETDEQVIQSLCITSSEMTTATDWTTDWTKVGTAEVTINLFDEKTIFIGKIENIKLKIQKVQADAEVAVNRLNDKLSQLQAITYVPAPADEDDL